jgi:hypothetical protein
MYYLSIESSFGLTIIGATPIGVMNISVLFMSVKTRIGSWVIGSMFGSWVIGSICLSTNLILYS